MSGHIKNLEDFLDVQTTLGSLGYTMSADYSYYKDYGLVDGSYVRLVPVFDKGTSLDKSYKLVAIDVVSQGRILIEEGVQIPLERFPRECLDDVTTILVKLAPSVAVAPKKEVFIIMANCTSCKSDVSSFFQRDGEATCIKCLGFDYPNFR